MKVDRKTKTEKSPPKVKAVKSGRRAARTTNGKHPLAAYEHVPVGIVETSLDGQYIEINEEFCRIMDYSRAELLQLSIKDCTHEDDYAIDSKLHEQLVTGKVPFYKLEKRYIRKSGEVIWVELTRTLVCDEKGKPRYAVGVILDISERKDVERVLHESVERLRLATEAAEMFMWEWDLQNQSYTLPDNFEQVLGFSTGLLPKNRFDTIARFVPQDDVQLITQAFQKALEDRGDMHALPCRVINPENGQIVWLEISAKIVYDDEKRPERVFGVAQNITASKKAQDEIAIISRFPAESPNPVMRLTPDGNILYANRASQELLEYWKQEINQTIPDGLQEVVSETFTTGMKKQIEIKHHGKYYLCTLAPILEAGYVNFYGNEITERKKAEAGLQLARRQAEQSADRMARLQKVTAALSDALTPPQVAEVLTNQGAPALGAVSSSVMWLVQDGETLEMVYSTSQESNIRPYKRFPVSLQVPAADVVRSGETVWIESRQQYLERYPHIADQINEWGLQAAIAVPMIYKEQIFGVLTLSFDRVFPYSPDDLDYALTLARQGAQAFERARAADVLRESEERFRALVSQATAGITQSDMDGELVFVNSRFCEMLGYSEEELLGKTIWRLTDPDDLDENQRLFQRMLDLGESYQIEKRFFRKDGSRLWTSVSVSSIRDLDGNVKGGVGVIIDIEQRKQAQGALAEFARQQQALYQLSDRLHRTDSLADIFNAALDAIINALQCDRASILLFDDSEVMRFMAWRGLSDRYRKATDGHSPWKPDSRDPEPISMDDVRTAELDESLRAVVLKEGIRSLAFIPLVSNGKLIGKFMIYFDSPHVFGAADLDLSLTIANQLAFGIERKRAEEALRIENERFMRFVDSNIVGILIGRADGEVLLANDYYLRLLGVSRQELMERHVDWKQFTPPEWLPADEKAIRELNENGVCEPYEKEYVRADGTRVPVYITNAMLPGPGEEIAAFVIDMTERKRAAEALRLSEQRFRGIFETAGVSVWVEDFTEVKQALEELRAQGVQDFRAYFAEHPDFVREAVKKVHILDVNKETLVLFGAQSKDDLLQSLGNVFLPETEPAFVEELIALAEGREVLNVESVQQTLDGHPISVIFTAHFGPATGDLSRVVVTLTDITERKRSENMLRIRARQQQAIAQLGELALRERDVQKVLEQSTAMIAQTLEIGYCKVLELLEEKNSLLLRAGVGWQEGLVGNTTVGAGLDTQAGFTLQSDTPVIVDDLRTEQRFHGPPLLFNHNIISGMSCIIHRADGKPWGVLGAHTSWQTTFTKDDVNFLTAMANILGDAIERQQTDDALRQSEERYRAVVESQAEMLCRFRPDGTILFVNEAYARARGTTAEELIRDNFWAFITEEDRPGVRAMLERLTPEELEVRIENRFQTVNGERWILWTNRALNFDDNGRAREVQSSGIDITDRKRVEESLQLSEQKFSSIFHAAPFAIALQKLPDSRFADVNDAFVQLFGYEREELIGRTSLEVGIQPDEAMRSRVIQQFEGQGFMRNAELQVKTKLGQMIWVSISAEVVKIAGEDHILALATDITARKQAEQDLRESEERYRFIVENTSDGIWWIELAEPMPVTLSEDEQVEWYYNHAIIRQCNLGLARMYGYSSVNEVLGLPLRLVMPRENPANLEMLRQFIRSGYRLVDTESREVASNGRELIFLNNMIGIVEEGMLKGEWGTNRDITERKRAEEALRESEERYRGIVNQTIAGIAETDLTGQYSMVNERYCEITGYRRNELLSNMRMQDVTHPDDLPHNLEQFRRLAADGTSFEIEKRYIRPDGSIVWVHNSVSAIVGADGSPRSAVAAAIDITERKRAEETLRRNEELFSTLVEAAPFGVYFIDSEFRLRAINKGSEAVFSGVYPLIGRDFAEILRIVWEEPFATETIERFRHTLRTGEPFISPPTIQPRANIDEIQSYDWQIHRITMPDGTYGVVCYFYDLSEQKRMEAAVRASESLYRAIARNIPGAGVYVVDKDLRYVVAEGPVTEAFGLTREMLEGRTVLEVFPDERGKRMEERLRRTFAGEIVSFETKFNGRVYWTQQAPLHESIGDAIILTLDITEHKQAEEALRQSEERFARFMQHLPGLAWIKDLEGHYVYANAAAERAFGTPLEKLYDSTDKDIFPPEVATQFRQNDEQALQDEKGIQVIETLEQDDGILHYSLVSKFPIPGPDGNTALIGGTAFDITERRQAEEALRESEERFRAILRQATAGIVRKDAEGRLIYVNQAFCNMLGYTEAELLGKTMWELVHEDDVIENKRSYERLMMEGIPFKLERRLRREDGSVIWVDASVSPIMDATGRPQSAVAVEIDINRRKQAEEALQQLNLQLEERVLSRTAKLRAVNQTLREEIAERRRVEEALRQSEAAARANEEKLSTLFQLLPVGISFLDLEGKIIQMNPALTTILKLSNEELADQTYRSRKYIRADGSWMPPSEFASQRALAEGKTIYNLETGVLLENSEVVWASVSAAPVAVADVGAVVVTVDITENKRAERALQESRERLQILSQRLVEVQEEERRAIARELHDRVGQTLAALNINLIIISGQLAGKIDEQVNARLSDSMKLVAETITLVRDVMSNLRPSVLDDYGLEAALQSHINEYMSRYDINVVLDKADPSIPRMLPSIEMTFLRIAQEALMNIARHAHASQVNLSLRQENGEICLIVEDNGIGIESWQRANRPGSHGLTIMRERAEAFGGNLVVSSVPHQGTRIEVRIPFDDSHPPSGEEEMRQ